MQPVADDMQGLSALSDMQPAADDMQWWRATIDDMQPLAGLMIYSPCGADDIPSLWLG